MDTEWFGRFRDVPGVAYEIPGEITRETLRLAQARPRKFVLGDQQVEALDESDDSGSPAYWRRVDSDTAESNTDDLIKNLYVTLEVPGAAEDYHFAIQDVIDELWRRRRSNSLVLLDVETLSWLDVSLIRARPDVVGCGAHLNYYKVPAFGRLITLYRREGAWRDALAVSDIGEQFGVYPGRAAILEQVAALDAEMGNE